MLRITQGTRLWRTFREGRLRADRRQHGCVCLCPAAPLQVGTIAKEDSQDASPRTDRQRAPSPALPGPARRVSEDTVNRPRFSLCHLLQAHPLLSSTRAHAPACRSHKHRPTRFREGSAPVFHCRFQMARLTGANVFPNPTNRTKKHAVALQPADEKCNHSAHTLGPG